VFAGDVVALDTEGCLIRSDGRLVAAVGVSGLMVVATRDSVLNVPCDQAQRVKGIVGLLEKVGRAALL
jgi:mannose-1-phosphate guanylyltransferase/mannose-1-phosphate guanylyltransferase/mannose-6-phosphate isomerase